MINSFMPKMVKIPTGTSLIGKEKISTEFSEFSIGIYPVTVQEFKHFISKSGYESEINYGYKLDKWSPNNLEHNPITNVEYDDANAYCKWLSEQTGNKYRLPTEAEWEYAARAWTTTDYWWGDTFLNHMANSSICITAVNTYSPNQFGLYDMIGNVFELCSTGYQTTCGGSSPVYNRNFFCEENNYTGFRVVME